MKREESCFVMDRRSRTFLQPLACGAWYNLQVHLPRPGVDPSYLFNNSDTLYVETIYHDPKWVPS
jgi:hypothetical protein